MSKKQKINWQTQITQAMREKTNKGKKIKTQRKIAEKQRKDQLMQIQLLMAMSWQQFAKVHRTKKKKDKGSTTTKPANERCIILFFCEQKSEQAALE